MQIGVTGHQNIPKNALPYITSGIEEVVNPASYELIGISSLADGADQLFAENVLKSGGKLHVIVPCERYESTFEDRGSLKRFNEYLDNADKIETLAYTHPSEEAFLDAGKRVADLSQLLVAVWDGREARGKGGTADIVNYALENDIDVVIIWPEGVKR